MPKMPEHEWREALDPASEEYAPTMREIKDDRIIWEEARSELLDIERQLNRPTEDSCTGKVNKLSVADPLVFWDRLADMRAERIDKIQDPDMRKELKEKVAVLESRVYKQFISFIESKINLFGLQHSPIKKYTSRNTIAAEDVEAQFKQARAALEHLKIPENEQIDFLSELDRLQEKFDRYKREPMLFAFEEKEEALQRAMDDAHMGAYGTPEELKESVSKIDALRVMARFLDEATGKMSDESIKMKCGQRAKDILDYIDRLEHFLKNKQKISEEAVHEAEDRFRVERGGVDWAWSLLGIQRGASRGEVRKAYHELALKYHPDLHNEEGAEEKMKKINEAFEFIKRVQGY